MDLAAPSTLSQVSITLANRPSLILLHATWSAAPSGWMFYSLVALSPTPHLVGRSVSGPAGAEASLGAAIPNVIPLNADHVAIIYVAGGNYSGSTQLWSLSASGSLRLLHAVGGTSD